MAYWLVKSEPDVYSIDDLKRDKVTCWSGVRNYQARNYLTAMKEGEKVLYYHSNADPAHVAGVAEVRRVAYPDPTQFDRKSDYFDSASSKKEPRWFSPELGFLEHFVRSVTLPELRQHPELADLELLRKGSRLSVMPVEASHFHFY